MGKTYFITLTGVTHYYGMKPFAPDRIVRLVKDPENEHDSEAIAVELPFIGKVAYVANSSGTVARGTCSAGRIYDLFESETYAQVLFITHASVICLVILPEESSGEVLDAGSREESGASMKPSRADREAKELSGFIRKDDQGFYINLSDVEWG